jgi:hypothetical protein
MRQTTSHDVAILETVEVAGPDTPRTPPDPIEPDPAPAPDPRDPPPFPRYEDVPPTRPIDAAGTEEGALA